MIQIKEISAEDCWPLRHVVMWPKEPIDYVKLPKDGLGIHYGLYKDGFLLSVISLFIEGKDAQFRKFATREKEQGKGYGTMLLTHLLEKLLEHKIDRIFCNARVEKASFYKKFGMRETSARFNKGGKSYVVMEKIT